MTDYTPDSLRALKRLLRRIGLNKWEAEQMDAHADTWEADQKAWSKTWERFASRIVALEAANAALRDALQQIINWSEAYPLDVFPEPSFKRAAELLNAGGMTLDAISASNMRHVVTGVGEIARKALASQPPESET